MMTFCDVEKLAKQIAGGEIEVGFDIKHCSIYVREISGKFTHDMRQNLKERLPAGILVHTISCLFPEGLFFVNKENS